MHVKKLMPGGGAMVLLTYLFDLSSPVVMCMMMPGFRRLRVDVLWDVRARVSSVLVSVGWGAVGRRAGGLAQRVEWVGACVLRWLCERSRPRKYAPISEPAHPSLDQ